MSDLSMIDFNLGMERLKGLFGEDVKNPIRMEIIGSKMKGLTVAQWNQVVENLIGSCRRAPVLRDFQKAAQEFLDLNAEQKKSRERQMLEIRHANNQACAECKDTGTVSAWRKKKPNASPYAFRCHAPGCIATHVLVGSHIPMWDVPTYGAEFILVPADKTPHQTWKENHEELFGFAESVRPVTRGYEDAVDPGFAAIVEEMKQGTFSPEEINENA